jgi:hypothetical protein
MRKKKNGHIFSGYVVDDQKVRSEIGKNWSIIENANLYNSNIIVYNEYVVQTKNTLEKKCKELDKIFN